MDDNKTAHVAVIEQPMETKGSTVQDLAEMDRMGKRQELKRTFRFISILGFATILQSTWEGVLVANSYGLFNGGTAGVIYSTIGVWIGITALLASLGEMASMAPTAGGQYHWVSEFAPPSMQGILSYVVGWCCCLGWVSGIPPCVLQLGGLTQQMILLTFPDLVIEELWQSTLIGIAFLLVVCGFNMFLNRYLALAETLSLAIHVAGFVIFMAVFWALAEHQDAYTVFTSFNNGGGWSSQGLSALVGLTTPLWCFVGSDASAHMAEELRDASVELPRAMMWSIVLNGILGIAMMISFCFCITDLEGLLDSADAFPIINVVYTTTNSVGGTIVLGCLLLLLLTLATITVVATTSRTIWAFSRDKGLPFSSWLSAVNPGWDVPVNAIIASMGISFLLLCINFGSNVALNAIASLSNAALLFSYIITVGCLRLRRIRGQPLLGRKWSLGRWGWLVNDIAMIFLIVSFIFSFFPEMPSVGDDAWAANFNWAVVIFVGTCAIALGLWFAGGKKRFVPPVWLVKKDDDFKY